MFSDPKIISDWVLAGVSALVGAVMGVGTALWQSRRAIHNDIAGLRRCIDEHARVEGERIRALEEAAKHQMSPIQAAQQIRKLSVIEESMRQAPTHKDLSHAHQRMDRLSEILGQVRGAVTRIEASVDTLTQHLLEHGPRKQ